MHRYAFNFQPPSFHTRLSRIREKMFRNEEAGLSMEGFIDALAEYNHQGGEGNKLLATPTRLNNATPTKQRIKDKDAR